MSQALKKLVTRYSLLVTGFKVTRYLLLVTVLLAAGYWLPATAYGQDRQKIILNLQQCIQKAVEVSPEIGEARYEEEVYKSKKMQADSAVYPQIELFAITGPSPKAKKAEFFRTDVKAASIDGIFGRAEVTLIQPIYTFGKIAGYREAAASGIRVAQAGTDKKTSDIVLRTKELYYSLLLAMDMRNLALEIKDDLMDSIKKAERQIEIDSPWADEANLYKLRAFLGEVKRHTNEAEKGVALARDALITSLGLPRDIDFDIADSTLTPEDRIPAELAWYLKNANEMRPEFIQLKEGLHARNALVRAERSGFYPQLFVGLRASVAGATNRDRIDNPYVFDHFNHAYGAAFMGLKWSIDFGITKGRVKEAESEYHKLAEKKRFAENAIPLQVRKAYLDFQEAEKNIVALENAYKNARKWVVTAMLNFDMGIGEAKEIGEAAAIYAQTKANYIRSVFNHRMSFANLLYAAGMDMRDIR
jgi:outer membrane protein TolC